MGKRINNAGGWVLSGRFSGSDGMLASPMISPMGIEDRLKREEAWTKRGSYQEPREKSGAVRLRFSMRNVADAKRPVTATLGSLMSPTGGVMPRVLIVDDEPDIADLLTDALIIRGYSASTAHDGPEALQKVKDVRPHVVLLDIDMPGMNGLEVLRHLRESDPEVVVIMVSGIRDEKTSQAALALGASDYFTKPLDTQALERSLRRHIPGNTP